jgi:ABC-2 type transport system permease protein
MSTVHGAASGRSALQELGAVWRYRSLVGNFAERELKSKYKRSVLGWTWSLINPAATLLIYTIVFSTIFRAEPPVAGNGTLVSYTVYLFIALVVWNFFAGVVNSSQAALIGAGPLLKKIYFPPFAPVLGNGISVLVQTLIEVGVLLVVLVVLQNIGWPVLLLAPLVVLLAVFALGIGLVFSLLNVYYRDIGYLVSLGLQLAFYATPVLYPPSLIPEETGSGIPARLLLQLNPMYHYVEAARSLLWHLQVPSAGEWLLLSAMAAGSFAVGWAVFHSRSRDVSEEL